MASGPVALALQQGMTMTWRMLNIAFVACNKNAARFTEDPAFIYRCENLAHALQVHGAKVWLGHISRFPAWSDWSVVVFHRPRYDLRFRLLRAFLGRRGVKVVADVDDLVFVESMAKHSPGVVNGLVSLESTHRQFKSHAASISSVDHVTVSTPNLAEFVRDENLNSAVTCIPNAIHWSWRKMGLSPNDGRRFVLGYLPGTRSHDRDFALIQPAIARLLDAHEKIRLKITGPLNHGLQGSHRQIEHFAKRPFADFHLVFDSVCMNLAPLEDTPFNRCKSANKVMEAAWWNIPTIHSHLPDAERFRGVCGHEAKSLSEFESMLFDWASDPESFNISLVSGTELRDLILPLSDVYDFAVRWLESVMDFSRNHAQEK